ncbi:substrate-binding and VWA domain-containing protein [Planotetraspora phitsanulokensis]|uniref:VWA domain-containing protein n=1 Tax=Planotetraspora phitsanulokensis TaxID=575192 RepID=A0A8J3U9B6_9ACTN|nr:substrate-binding and VWA domain-containing protein [Planotetraspora phitsanulokensis]GII40675.1 VWA domain-containing protein [Planotetraspora phitsanulokensis]
MYPPAQRRRRGFAPFIIAIVVAGALIVGLRALFGGTDAGGSGGSSSSEGSGTGQSACGDDGVKLNIVASSEKAAVLRTIADAYNGREAAGRCAEVVVTTKASGDAMQALARGWDTRRDGPKPDVWTPASAGWVSLLQQRMPAAADRAAPVPAQNPTIAASPLVIAMPKPMAQALGWPSKKIGWTQILDLANDPKGWAKYGHPEWGPFRLGKTNPNYSTSGLNATIGAYFAATGLSGDLTKQDVANAKTRKFISGMERSIVHYGDISLTFLSNLQHADDAGTAMSYISAVTIEEKSVWDYNQGNPSGDPKTLGQHAKPKVPLVAIYPAEGTLFSDHPYAELTGLDPAKKAAADDFLKYLRSEGQREFAKYAFRSFDGKAGDLITAENGLNPKEPATTLSVPAPAVLDEILKSWGELRKPANVLMVIDTSGSMGADVPGTGKSKLDLAKQAAINALSQFGPNDKVGLWMFSLNQDGAKDYRALVPVKKLAKGELTDRIRDLIPNGGTGLYDTALASYQDVMSRRGDDTINAVVLLTDGKNEDNNSITLDDLLPDLRTEAGQDTVRLFTIAYGADADLDVLKQISQTTDAAAYDSREPGSIDQVFTAVISNF